MGKARATWEERGRGTLAVVLPAFNEAAGLETLIWRIVRSLGEFEYEVVIVDDGSTDETAEIAKSLAEQFPLRLIRHADNRGYGAAIRTGLLAARDRADIVLTMDADDSHDPSLIPLMARSVLCGSDVVIASRFVPGGREIGVPMHRRVLSRGAGFVFRRLLHIDGIRDYTSGYRAYRSDFLDELVDVLGPEGFVEETGFTVGVELLLKSDRLGGRLAEVPLVLRYDRKRSESKLNIRETLADYARLLGRVSSLEGRQPAEGDEKRSWWDSPDRDGVVATLAGDVISVLAAFALSFLLYRTLIDVGWLDRGYPASGRYALLAALYAGTTVLTFLRFGLYAPRTSELQVRQLQQTVFALTVSVAFFFAALFFVSARHPSRLLVSVALLSSYPIVLVTRSVVTVWLRARRSRSDRVSRALIYGAGATGRLLMKKIRAAPRFGTDVIGFLDDSKPVGFLVRQRISRIDGDVASAEVLGTRADLASVVMETGATDLYLTVSTLSDGQFSRIHEEATNLGLRVGIVPRLGSTRPDQLQVEDLGAIPVVRRHSGGISPVYEPAKRALDLFCVAVLALPALVVGLFTAAAIRLEGSPVLFRQTRIGRKGRPFTILKFRTMHPETEPYADSPTNDDDSRISRVGRFVRMAGLDELPQLINVLRGEMSMVGPRPEMPYIVAGYSEVEQERLAVRPGITGLWQLSPDRSDAIHGNLEYDLYYLRNRTLTLDVLVLGETLGFVARALLRLTRAAWRGAWRIAVSAVRGIQVSSEGHERRVGRPAANAERFVFVALDQRRRPDEPASWGRYVPTLASLSDEYHIKLLVANRNSDRIHELTDEARSGNGEALEYVPYGEGSVLRRMTERANIVVTDLPHVAALASSRGRPVVVIEDGRIHTRATSDVQTSLVPFVERMRDMLDGGDDRWRLALT